MGRYRHLGEPDYIDDNGFDSRFPEVPGKILYGMNMAFNASLRSKDQSTKCGCFVTDLEGGTLASGYNSPMRGVDDSQVPTSRPRKYFHMEHSERNAIFQSAKKGISLDNSVFFVNGFPCIDCSRAMIHSGAREIFYGPIMPKMCENNLYEDYELLFSAKTCKLIKFKYLNGLVILNPNFKKKIKGYKEINWEFNI